MEEFEKLQFLEETLNKFNIDWKTYSLLKAKQDAACLTFEENSWQVFYKSGINKLNKKMFSPKQFDMACKELLKQVSIYSIQKEIVNHMSTFYFDRIENKEARNKFDNSCHILKNILIKFNISDTYFSLNEHQEGRLCLTMQGDLCHLYLGDSDKEVCLMLYSIEDMDNAFLAFISKLCFCEKIAVESMQKVFLETRGIIEASEENSCQFVILPNFKSHC